MVQAEQSLEQAEIAVHQAGASARPSASTQVGFNRSRSRRLESGWSWRSSKSLSASLSLSWMIYDFGATKSGVKRAVAAYTAAGANYRNAGVQRIAQVRQAYFTVAQQEALRGVKEEALRQSQLLLEQAELKLDIGTGKKYDVTKARVECSAAEYDLVLTSNAVATARVALNQQLGFAESVAFVLNPDVTLSDPPETFEELMAIAATNQPALVVAAAMAEAASFAVDQAVASLYPNLSLSGSASYTILPEPRSVSLGFGGNIVQSLFSGWRKTDDVDHSVAQLRSARAQLALAEQQAAGDIATMLANLQTARAARAISTKQLQQAKENLDLVSEQFSVGNSSILDRTAALVSYTSALANDVNAQYSLEIAKAKMYALLGME
ncbi:MAG: TolC family protein [Kiritimatiellaeota bacterium]|nr:TolC family protein [Kiritimatiellota bacterium]